MQFISRKTASYSLAEMLVVLAVLAILSLLTVPTLSGQNDRYMLDNSASNLRQMLLKAKVMSVAPVGNSSEAASAQYYQVSIGDLAGYGSTFGENGSPNIAFGDDKTSAISLEKGLNECGVGDIGSRVALESVKLPKNVYIASFFPFYSQSAQPPTEDDPLIAFIRFSQGKEGFSCGSDGEAQIGSLVSNEGGIIYNVWLGHNAQNGELMSANNLYIELKSKKLPESRFVVIDRLTSDVTIQRSVPNRYFRPVGDYLAPQWVEPLTQSISVPCGSSSTNITLRFSRAQDRFGEEEPGQVDDNRSVFYDIDWSVDEANFFPLVTKYYWDTKDKLDQPVIYNFTTSLVTKSQPNILSFRITAYDEMGLRTSSRDFSFTRGVDFSCVIGEESKQQGIGDGEDVVPPDLEQEGNRNVTAPLTPG